MLMSLSTSLLLLVSAVTSTPLPSQPSRQLQTKSQTPSPTPSETPEPIPTTHTPKHAGEGSQADTKGMMSLHKRDEESTVEATTTVSGETTTAETVEEETTTVVTTVDEGITTVGTTVEGETTTVGTTVEEETTTVGTTVEGEITTVGTTVEDETTTVGTTVEGETTAVGTTVEEETTTVGTTVEGETSAVGTTATGKETTVEITVEGETTTVGTTVEGGTTAVGTTEEGETTSVGTTLEGETTAVGTTVSGHTTATIPDTTQSPVSISAQTLPSSDNDNVKLAPTAGSHLVATYQVNVNIAPVGGPSSIQKQTEAPPTEATSKSTFAPSKETTVASTQAKTKGAQTLSTTSESSTSAKFSISQASSTSSTAPKSLTSPKSPISPKSSTSPKSQTSSSSLTSPSAPSTSQASSPSAGEPVSTTTETIESDTTIGNTTHNTQSSIAPSGTPDTGKGAPPKVKKKKGKPTTTPKSEGEPKSKSHWKAGKGKQHNKGGGPKKWKAKPKGTTAVPSTTSSSTETSGSPQNENTTLTGSDVTTAQWKAHGKGKQNIKGGGPKKWKPKRKGTTAVPSTTSSSTETSGSSQNENTTLTGSDVTTAQWKAHGKGKQNIKGGGPKKWKPKRKGTTTVPSTTPSSSDVTIAMTQGSSSEDIPTTLTGPKHRRTTLEPDTTTRPSYTTSSTVVHGQGVKKGRPKSHPHRSGRQKHATSSHMPGQSNWEPSSERPSLEGSSARTSGDVGEYWSNRAGNEKVEVTQAPSRSPGRYGVTETIDEETTETQSDLFYTNEGPGSDGTSLSPGQKPDLDSTEVTIKAGHYTVTVSHDILDVIVNFFNTVDANEDDVIDSAEMTDQWEQLDGDSDGVLSKDEIHGKMTWFELYAMDVDGDGIATNIEFEKATKSLDLDGNGKVELNEFIVMNALVRNQNMDKHNTYRR